VPTLTELFRGGVNREKGGPVFEELGLSVWFGNGEGKNARASLQITCGGYSEVNPNVCVLNLPSAPLIADRVLTTTMLTHVVRSMVLAWEPDWAIARSNAYTRQYPELRSEPFSLGWVTYLARRLGTVPPLPAPVRIEPVEDRGTLIVLTPERFTVANPEHVELARRVHELLVRAGLMKPLTS
jgi:hypothetical protein